MVIFCRRSVELAKEAVVNIVMGFVLVGGLAFLTGCPSPSSPGGVTGQQPQPPPGKFSVGENLSVTLNERRSKMVTLPYKSEGGAVPTSCELRSLSGVVETSGCTCLAGTCRVGVLGKKSGDGSFDFCLFGQNGVSSGFREMRVKILEVTLSAVSEEKQYGTVGETLPAPIVVSAKNSNNEPVSGVKIIWEPTGGSQVDSPSCMQKTDDEGLAKCTWTLGTKMEDDDIRHRLLVSAFFGWMDSGIENRFKVIFDGYLEPGSPFKLSFSPQSHGAFPSYHGPNAREPAGIALGAPSGVQVYAQDRYGNRTKVGKGVVVTMSLFKLPEGGVLLGNEKAVMSNEKEGEGTRQEQGVATFKDLKLQKLGDYSLIATSPGLESVTSREFTVVEP